MADTKITLTAEQQACVEYPADKNLLVWAFPYAAIGSVMHISKK